MRKNTASDVMLVIGGLGLIGIMYAVLWGLLVGAR